MNRRSALSAHMRYLPVPAPVHELQLSPGALSVYIYLIRCKDSTQHCYPSYKTIGEHVCLSANTVAKCVKELEKKMIIETERTSVIYADGKSTMAISGITSYRSIRRWSTTTAFKSDRVGRATSSADWTCPQREQREFSALAQLGIKRFGWSGFKAMLPRPIMQQEKVEGLLKRSSTGHCSRQRRLRRAFSGFKDEARKGVAHSRPRSEKGLHAA